MYWMWYGQVWVFYRKVSLTAIYILNIYMNTYVSGIHLKRSNGYRRNSFEGTEWIPKCEWTRIVVADTIAWYDNIESLLSRTEVTHAIWKDYMRYLRRPTTQCSRFSFIINKLTILFQKATLWDKSLIYRCLCRTSVFTRREITTWYLLVPVLVITTLAS